jgi:hypothetical protein
MQRLSSSVAAVVAGIAFLVSGGTALAASVTIGILGDYGSAYAGGRWYSNELAVANLIKSWNPDFIITTGDNNYPDGEASNIDTNIGQFFHEFIHPYVGTFGEGAVSNRFFPSIGNHDWASGRFGVAGLQPYLDYFTLPGNEHYYNYRYWPVEIFALASDQMEPDGAVANSIQALWLSNALAVSTAPWRIVYFHASPYSSGALHGTHTRQSTNMIWPFLEWGASAIFAGHDHIYERVFTNGLNYSIIGVGGDRIDGFHPIPTAGSIVRYNATYGAARLQVTETNFHYAFMNISNQVIDTYTLEAFPGHLALRLGDNAVELRLTGTPGRSYLIEASPNLVEWQPLSTNLLDGNEAVVPDGGPATGDGRFYRASMVR